MLRNKRRGNWDARPRDPFHKFSMKTLRSLSLVQMLLLGGFVLIIGVFGVLIYTTMRDLVASWQVTGLTTPGEFVPSAPMVTLTAPVPPVPPIDFAAPLQPVAGPPAKVWDGESRVTVLFIGLDSREWDPVAGPPRADTLILITLDPATSSMGMLSIPRDLWVNIPGYGQSKINTAYQIGERDELPGGGAGLTLKTVEDFFGITIQHYAQIDFDAFINIIDEIGGLELNLTEPIMVDPLGEGNTVSLEPGVQVLTGAVTLAYARARNTGGGDFDRVQRQQQVLLGIRDQVTRLELMPTIINRSPNIYTEIQNGLNTNLTLEQAIRLALLVQDTPQNNIVRGMIGPNQVAFGRSAEGWDILIPLPDEIRAERDRVFTANVNLVSPVASQNSLRELALDEGAGLAVFNGTTTPGLAASTTQFLESTGLEVTWTDNATELFPFTTVIDYTGNPYTLQYVIDRLGILPSRVFHSYAVDPAYDIQITLGADWVTSDLRP